MLSTSESSRGALASFAVSDLSSLSLSLLAHPPPLPAPPPKPPNQRPQVDLRELRKLAVVNGLGTNALRARAWPLLLGARAGADDLDVLQRLSSASSPSACSSDSDPDGGKRGPPPPPLHRGSAVVDVDVERSLWAFTRGWSEGARASARAALRRVINASVAEASRELQGRAEAQEDGNAERIGDETSAAEKLRQPRRKREASRSSSSPSLPEEEAESKGNGGRSGTGNDGRSGTGGGGGNGIGGGGVNSGASTVHYYQGLHDVASVLLLVTGSEVAAFRLLRRLAGCQLRDFTRPTLDAALEAHDLRDDRAAARVERDDPRVEVAAADEHARAVPRAHRRRGLHQDTAASTSASDAASPLEPSPLLLLLDGGARVEGAVRAGERAQVGAPPQCGERPRRPEPGAHLGARRKRDRQHLVQKVVDDVEDLRGGLGPGRGSGRGSGRRRH